MIILDGVECKRVRIRPKSRKCLDNGRLVTSSATRCNAFFLRLIKSVLYLLDRHMARAYMFAVPARLKELIAISGYKSRILRNAHYTLL
ncbi:hypothetical protein Plhal304r1_c029g0095211 [Plasmopara halstedii]